MYSYNGKLTRRDFLKTGSLAFTSLFLPFPLFADNKSDVVEVTAKSVLQGRRINRDVCKKMLEKGIMRLMNTSTAQEGIQKIFPGLTLEKTITIKINTINDMCPTHPEAVYALCDILTSTKIGGKPFPAHNIIIWDREESELKNAGFPINTGSNGVRVIANETDGFGFEKEVSVYNSTQKLARILTHHTDYLVNFAVLKHHGLADVTLTMKNHYGSVSNAWSMHSSGCNPYLVALNSLPEIKNKPTLFLVDALFGLNRGGPRGYPNFRYHSFLFSRDTVAIDKRGFDIIKANGGNINNTEFLEKSHKKLGNMDYRLIKLTL